MAIIVIALPGLVSRVAMPSLGALLILAGIKSLKPAEAASVWHAGWPSRLAGGTTFLATLFLPIQAAVGLGVVLSALLFVTESSTDVTLVEVVKRPDGRIEERKVPSRLEGQRVTILDVYGHLFYAGARTLANLLPRPNAIRNPVVILRLRGRNQFGATLIDVLSEYADSLRRVDGRLYLTGIGPGALRQLLLTGKFRPSGPVRAYRATPVIGESTERAHTDAEAWLMGLGKEESSAA
jgi:SulP family sulfate permease